MKLSNYYDIDHIRDEIYQTLDEYGITVQDHHQSSDHTSSVYLQIPDPEDETEILEFVLSEFPGNACALILHEITPNDLSIGIVPNLISATIHVCRVLGYSMLMANSHSDNVTKALIEVHLFSPFLRDIRDYRTDSIFTILGRIVDEE